jgi:hypothetical protein
MGIENNARYWSTAYQAFLAQNVQPGVLPARRSYVSVTEMESKLGSFWNSYDQYEVGQNALGADMLLVLITPGLVLRTAGNSSALH